MTLPPTIPTVLRQYRSPFPRARIMALSSFALLIFACGGRSGMNLPREGEGSKGGDAGVDLRSRIDGATDGIFRQDGSFPGNPDARLDGPGNKTDVSGEGRPNTFDASPVRTETRPNMPETQPSVPDLRSETVRDTPPDNRPVLPDAGPDPVVITAITLSPSVATINANTNQPFSARAIYSDRSQREITTQATWSTSDARIAEISNLPGRQGMATARLEGKVLITATYEGQTGSATLVVTGVPTEIKALTIDPTFDEVTVGNQQVFEATLEYADGRFETATNAIWTSSDPKVATLLVGRQRTLATGVAEGVTTITVSVGGFSATATLTVVPKVTFAALFITPIHPNLRVNDVIALTANAVYSDGHVEDVSWADNAIWSSSDPSIASFGPLFSRSGEVVGRSVGKATITVSYLGQNATTTVTVNANRTLVGISFAPPQASVRVGGTATLQPIYRYNDGSSEWVYEDLLWSTSDPKIAVVDAGVVYGIGPGTVTVTAKDSAYSATAIVTVRSAEPKSIVLSPPTLALQVGQSQGLVANMIMEDGTSSSITETATWTSSDPSIAIVVLDWDWVTSVPLARVTAFKTGTVTILASQSNIVGQATVNVTDRALLSLQISPVQTTLTPLSAASAFTATAIFDDYSTRNVTQEATWSSSATAVAVVSNTDPEYPIDPSGRVTAISVGNATISAAYGGKLASSQVTVVARKVVSVQISPPSATVPVGVPQSFMAQAIFDDHSTQNITADAVWISSDPKVAGIDLSDRQNVVAIPHKAGVTTLSVTYQGMQGTVQLTVTSAKLTHIAITPSPLSLGSGMQKQLIATGTYDDASTRDLTALVTWLSSNVGILFVSNASGTRGLATSLGSGTATVEAHFLGVAGTLTVTVGVP